MRLPGSTPMHVPDRDCNNPVTTITLCSQKTNTPKSLRLQRFSIRTVMKHTATAARSSDLSKNSWWIAVTENGTCTLETWNQMILVCVCMILIMKQVEPFCLRTARKTSPWCSCNGAVMIVMTAIFRQSLRTHYHIFSIKVQVGKRENRQHAQNNPWSTHCTSSNQIAQLQTTAHQRHSNVFENDTGNI